MTIYQGRVWKFGNDIDTDVIIPVRYCGGTDLQMLGRHCMEGVHPNFSAKVKAGDIIVAGKNFGCGSSREPAALAIKFAGIACIIARSFARIFYRNAFNVGLPLLDCNKADSINEGDQIKVNLDTGQIMDLTTEKSFLAQPIPSFMQDLIRNGGLMEHISKKMNIMKE
jgi:3-isopropylmalate/(R)-2-methylmalate dehydratase small subunit